MADRMAVMESGRLVQVGTPQQIYRNPANGMVAEFIGETNLIPAIVQNASKEPGVYEVSTSFGALYARANRSDWQPNRGDKVHLSIRPEALGFEAHKDSLNQMPGHIVDVIYLGATAQYEIQLLNGPLVKACEINPTLIRHASDERVALAAWPQDVVMLPSA
jgi:ABC-type Fe3+/spermidine/putrescine transport system ATPase subunit